ncbi:hypothetical protein COU49_01060 [Candidatus Nomurabacteria bacterium CG10_big_fil_rev_8_21_14_0_10_35_16]|uniref:DUF4015 domain-containing protein n=1 Tax=Candidatus Nomurabacteria bacterium CG10_big_fil_rev_8_21_14_0_10_35_16 TaxID=1974731 RepID=A0A2H0TBP5_9BACT|nr:MAG: hypothetical protein COU49_01060 [Candidatus Nomurabacteria bacterium CG10_big_fil_rev_8_21_14_0_10_35_16]
MFFNTSNNVEIPNLAQLDKVIENLESEEEIYVSDDIELQKPLENPPEEIKAIYATGWSAGSTKTMNRLINLIKDTELNAIVIDIKDYSGNLSYYTEIPELKEYNAYQEIKISKPNTLIKRLHDEGIYVIARQTVFQDPVLALARPDLALTSSSTGNQWTDYKGVMWMDTSAKEVWEYNVKIAKDALARGFDEINFDYIRFASDGDMDDIIYPYWDGVTLKRYIVRDFFKYLRQSLPDAKISGDLFGYTTILYGDLGIGQNIDDAFNYFDAIAPMTYPSHYNKWFEGFENPAEHPYEVLYKSMSIANNRLAEYKIKAALSTSTEKYLVKEPKLRPWLQDFDLGAEYDAEKVRAQINASDMATGACTEVPAVASTSSNMIICDEKSDKLGGWMLWDPRNIYTKEALKES